MSRDSKRNRIQNYVFISIPKMDINFFYSYTSNLYGIELFNQEMI